MGFEAKQLNVEDGTGVLLIASNLFMPALLIYRFIYTKCTVCILCK